MLLLFTFALSLILGDLVKITWGAEYKSIMAPKLFDGSVRIFGASIPKYNFFLLIIGPLVAIGLWLFTNKTKLGKIARAAAVDREMVGAVGINVSWVFAFAFVLSCFRCSLTTFVTIPRSVAMPIFEPLCWMVKPAGSSASWEMEKGWQVRLLI